MKNGNTLLQYDLWAMSSLIDSWKDDLALQELRNKLSKHRCKNHLPKQFRPKKVWMWKRTTKHKNYQKFQLSKHPNFTDTSD